MKNLYILFVLCVFTSSNAQNSIKKADRLFDQMWYKEAAVMYEVALQKDENNMVLLQKAGDSYFFNTDMENAYVWYDKLISNFHQEVSSEYLFRYAHALQGIGKNGEAKRWMKNFAKRAGKDRRSLNFDQEGQTIEDIMNLESRFLLRNIAVNTAYSDFGPMYYKNKLVYASAIDSSNFHTRLYHWNEQPFLNLYLGELNALESDVKLIDEFSENINTRYHEATLAFSQDEKKVYFTRNNFNGDLGRDNDGTNHLKLYSAEIMEVEDGKKEWQNIQELPFNSEDYSVGHPSVSKDGKLLYFVSDMPGSVGATDIFVVDILSDGYSKPRNLGEDVNTSGREMFPYITDKGLYFASDGHLGLGGLDVFSSDLQDGNFKTAINLGAPLNSKLDDFGLIIKESDNIGFVCSNREGGKGDDDIYSFVRLAPSLDQSCSQAIEGYISNDITGERISHVNLTLIDVNGKTLDATTTDANGSYLFETTLDCGAEHNVVASKTGYSPKEKIVITEKSKGITNVPLGLRTLNELIVEESGVLKIKIGIIYFDLDKYFIRNDAAIELNKIVLLMTQYPKMAINIESHTDSRSPDDYNLTLSQNRANATRDYLVSQRISSDRINQAQGFGETQLVNDCKNGVKCNDTQHQLNRRSEFIIVKM